jgi:metal-responsive CopG/Arc/MetJ family transcriptional regulator
MKTQQSINFDTEILQELRAMAKKRGCSVSRLVNDVLRMGLDSRNEMLKDLETVNLVELVRGLKKVVKDHARK